MGVLRFLQQLAPLAAAGCGNSYLATTALTAGSSGLAAPVAVMAPKGSSTNSVGADMCQHPQ